MGSHESTEERRAAAGGQPGRSSNSSHGNLAAREDTRPSRPTSARKDAIGAENIPSEMPRTPLGPTHGELAQAEMIVAHAGMGRKETKAGSVVAPPVSRNAGPSCNSLAPESGHADNDNGR